jgi:uncharacterized coiled-coil protein SlyX
MMMVAMLGCADARYTNAVNESSDAGMEGSGSETLPVAKDDDSVAADSVKRRIIYEAELSLIVSNFGDFSDKLPELVKAANGYVADAKISTRTGRNRSGQWVVRLPTDRFETFLSDVEQLGILENRSQTAQDVTREFVDLEARLGNLRRLETRLVELLTKTNDELKEVLEVERELSRVRGEIEQLQGQLRYLTNRTELTTVTVIAREEVDYVPPRSPDFSGRITSAWTSSWLALKTAGQNAAVTVVFLLPWILCAMVVAVPVWLVLRRSHRARVV